VTSGADSQDPDAGGDQRLSLPVMMRVWSDRFAGAARLISRLPTELQAFWTMLEAGVIGPDRADRLWAMYRTLERYGPMGAAVSAAAIRHGSRLALVDEKGSLTFEQMDRRSNAVANALRARGFQAGTGVGIMCRNHRGIFDASFGALKAGARALYLNTDFAGPQAKEVCAREGVEVLIHDEEFSAALSRVKAPKGRFLAWHEGAAGGPSLESLIGAGNPDPPAAPGSPGEAIILTSGTTGSPKGATRGMPRSLSPLAAVLSRIPFRSREVTYVAPPV
jgi:fatty-acyl-CoA synthase